jgi:uncharacterized protein Yka (UPF0111/DUF47 family)
MSALTDLLDEKDEEIQRLRHFSKDAEIERLKEKISSLEHQLDRLARTTKIRIAFINHPNEPKNADGPDWSEVCALIEQALL